MKRGAGVLGLILAVAMPGGLVGCKRQARAREKPEDARRQDCRDPDAWHRPVPVRKPGEVEGMLATFLPMFPVADRGRARQLLAEMLPSLLDDWERESPLVEAYFPYSDQLGQYIIDQITVVDLRLPVLDELRVFHMERVIVDRAWDLGVARYLADHPAKLLTRSAWDLRPIGDFPTDPSTRWPHIRYSSTWWTTPAALELASLSRDCLLSKVRTVRAELQNLEAVAATWEPRERESFNLSGGDVFAIEALELAETGKSESRSGALCVFLRDVGEPRQCQQGLK